MIQNNFFTLLIFSLECFDIKVTINKKDHLRKITWILGSCASSNRYIDHMIYLERCCLHPGIYVLSCYDDRNEGWNNAYLDILGHRYCDDFLGYKAMRRVTIPG